MGGMEEGGRKDGGGEAQGWRKRGREGRKDGWRG